MKRVLLYLTVLVGALVGAGFASGKEIDVFFVRFGKLGYVGIGFASMLFSISIYLTLRFLKNRRGLVFLKLLEHPFWKVVVSLFSMACFCMMIAALGAFMSQKLHLKAWYGRALGSSACYFLLKKRQKGIELASLFLVPLIVLGMLKWGTSSVVLEESVNVKPVMNMAYIPKVVFSSIIYVGYNLLVILPLLINLKEHELTKQEIWWITIAFLVLTSTLMVLSFAGLLRHAPKMENIELPSLWIASRISYVFGELYGIVILLAIFTTALSCGFNLVSMPNSMRYEMRVLLLCVGAFLLSGLGFSTLMDICYPFFGMIGILQVLVLFFKVRKVS